MKTNSEKIEKVIEELNQKVIPEISNNINHINSGGCGIFAILLYERLTKLGIKNIKVIPLVDPENTEVEGIFPNGEDHVLNVKDHSNSFNNYIINTLKEKKTSIEANSVGWTHIMVAIEEDQTHTFLVDGTKIKHFSKVNTDDVIEENWFNNPQLAGNEIKYEDLKALCTSGIPNLWNPHFDIKQIPKLKEIIDELI